MSSLLKEVTTQVKLYMEVSAHSSPVSISSFRLVLLMRVKFFSKINISENFISTSPLLEILWIQRVGSPYSDYFFSSRCSNMTQLAIPTVNMYYYSYGLSWLKSFKVNTREQLPAVAFGETEISPSVLLYPSPILISNNCVSFSQISSLHLIMPSNSSFSQSIILPSGIIVALSSTGMPFLSTSLVMLQ